MFGTAGRTPALPARTFLESGSTAACLRVVNKCVLGMITLSDRDVGLSMICYKTREVHLA